MSEAASRSSSRTRVASDDDVARAIATLRDGGVIALPTDTVYGIAASLDHPDAIERLFTIKGRSGTKAVPILVSSLDDLDHLTSELTAEARALAARFWPGALTIVVSASDLVPDGVRRDGETVGIRMPDSADALAVIAGAGGALAVTSANRSGEVEARSAAEVNARLGGRIDFVLDGGASPSSQPSTVVDASQTPVRVLRAGAIAAWHITAALEEQDR